MTYSTTPAVSHPLTALSNEVKNYLLKLAKYRIITTGSMRQSKSWYVRSRLDMHIDDYGDLPSFLMSFVSSSSLHVALGPEPNDNDPDDLFSIVVICTFSDSILRGTGVG
jgi:hypothetical protein